MKRRLIILFAILAVCIVFGYLWITEAVSPANPSSTATTMFVVRPGEQVRSIASRLKEEEIIRDPLAFFIIVKKLGVEKKIQAGDFRLSPHMTLYEVIDQLQHGTVDVWVTVPEGWRSEEIALKLAQALAVPEQEFLKHAEEGYMFPDTYLFPRQATASGAASIMRANFDKRVREPLAVEIESGTYTLDELLTIASLVEREARFDEDRPVIASVIANRLREEMPLNIDATLQYALGYQSDEGDWWKKGLTNEDKEIDSPYNTYKYAGLPPGPIANPGLASIKAVLDPAETNYIYYIHDAEGKIHTSRTLEEHNENVQNYLGR